MMDKWSVDAGEFRLTQNKLKLVTDSEHIGSKDEAKTRQWIMQAWIHQKEINKRLMSLVEQLQGRR